MTTKALRKQLVAAIAMVLVAALALGSATFAWFSMNNKVTVTGMKVNTKVSNNLLIADDTLGSTAKKADSLFTNSLVQNVEGLLEPVSTVNGKNFFYTATNNVKADGDAMNDVYVAYASGDAFDGNYGLNNTNSEADALGYVDYVFQLKAINGPTASQIRLTKLDLTYGGTADAGKAYRVAMFVEDITGGTATAAAGDLVTIFTESGAANFTAGKAVDDVDSFDDVTYCSNNTTAKIDVAANATKYYKVVVRLWLEGEDTTCNNTTYMSLTDKWSLDLAFEMVDATAAASAVQYITKNVTAAKTALLTSDTVGSTAVVINGVSYYPITGKQLDSKDLYVMTDTALTTSSRVFTIEQNNYPTEVTNQVSITTP